MTFYGELTQNTGIGRQTAISFAFEGCDRIAITDTSSNGLGITKFAIEQAGLETKVLALTVDVRDEKAVIDAVAKAVEEFGRIDYAVNCAGTYLTPFQCHDYSIIGVSDMGYWTNGVSHRC